MSLVDKFLESYKNLEAELKAEGMTILDYENKMKEGTEKERLKVCRIMRNYMSHNDTVFLDATNEQIKFIDGLTLGIRRQAHTVKDEMKKVTPVKETEQLKNMLASIDKYPIIPIITKQGIYLLDKDTFVHLLAKGEKKAVIPARLPKYKYVDKNERIENLGSGTYIVTSTGKSDGTYAGIIIV